MLNFGTFTGFVLCLVFSASSLSAEITSVSQQPGGSSGQIQFNQNYEFAGSTGMTYSTTTHTISITSVSASGSIMATDFYGDGSKLTGISAGSSGKISSTDTLQGVGSIYFATNAFIGPQAFIATATFSAPVLVSTSMVISSTITRANVPLIVGYGPSTFTNNTNITLLVQDPRNPPVGISRIVVFSSGTSVGQIRSSELQMYASGNASWVGTRDMTMVEFGAGDDSIVAISTGYNNTGRKFTQFQNAIYINGNQTPVITKDYSSAFDLEYGSITVRGSFAGIWSSGPVVVVDTFSVVGATVAVGPNSYWVFPASACSSGQHLIITRVISNFQYLSCGGDNSGTGGSGVTENSTPTWTGSHTFYSSSITVTGAGPARAYLLADTDNSNEADTPGVYMSMDGVVTTGNLELDQNNNMVLGANSTTAPNLYFATRSDGTSFPASTDAKMTILNAGNVGIGTLVPSSKLDVFNGSVTIRGLSNGLGVSGSVSVSSSVYISSWTAIGSTEAPRAPLYVGQGTGLPFGGSLAAGLFVNMDTVKGDPNPIFELGSSPSDGQARKIMFMDISASVGTIGTRTGQNLDFKTNNVDQMSLGTGGELLLYGTSNKIGIGSSVGASSKLDVITGSVTVRGTNAGLSIKSSNATMQVNDTIVYGATQPYRTTSIPLASCIGGGASSASWSNGGLAISTGFNSSQPWNRIPQEAWHEFRNDTYSYVFCSPFRMPYTWDGSTVGFSVSWEASTGPANQNVVWSVGAVAQSSGTTSYPVFTSSVSIVSTNVSSYTVTDTIISDGFQVEGLPRPGAKIRPWLTVSGGDGRDTFTGIARGIELTIFYREAYWDGGPR